MPFLVTPPLPSLRVEIAFDSGFATAEGDRTWTDVSAWVEGASSVDITYGRADELSTPDPNTCSLTLDNSDGRFTPGKASSPYFPNVKKGKPLRVTVTYAGVDYVRFTGYVTAWPLVWPDGSSAASSVTITAASRRSRLGQTAPLTSAIRAAYLATGPTGYWPLSDDIHNTAGQSVFLDITNTLVDERAVEDLGGYSESSTLTPIRDDGLIYPHPTDEGGLVFFPKAPAGAFHQYVGAGQAMNVDLAAGITAEIVARVTPLPTPGENVWVVPFMIGGPHLSQELSVYAYDSTNTGGGRTLGVQQIIRDDNGAIIETGSFFAAADPGKFYDKATDGKLHHWLVVSDDTISGLYLDGEDTGNVSLLFSSSFTDSFQQLAIGMRTENGSLNAGHMAITPRVLTDAEIRSHARAAIAAEESPEERVVRVAGRLGVPEDEIEVEDTIAGSLGPQPEAGQSAASILDDVATSTGGVLYDTREGHLAMQARNHRYNLASAFSLSAVEQEIQGDLTVTDDHRYTINTVEYTRSGSDAVATTITDDASIEAYGVFSQTYAVTSESDAEVEAFAQNVLTRYADPDPRVSTVSVDVVNLESTQRDAVLSADIGTRFGLADLAEQAPADPMFVFYEGATESITATSHTLTMNTTPADIGQNVFILDNPTYGVLDQNVLAY